MTDKRLLYGDSNTGGSLKIQADGASIQIDNNLEIDPTGAVDGDALLLTSGVWKPGTVSAGADSEARSAAASAGTLASEAQSAADSAGLLASTAYSATGSSGTDSVAQSKADSAGTLASEAQSSADSAGLLASTAYSAAGSGGTDSIARSSAESAGQAASVADSKATSGVPDSVAQSSADSAGAFASSAESGVTSQAALESNDISIATSRSASQSLLISGANSAASSAATLDSTSLSNSDSKTGSAVSNANSKDTSQSLLISIANSAGVSAATLDSTSLSNSDSKTLSSVSTADSKDASQSLLISTADSKAVSDSLNTSTAQSAAGSAGGLASNADSKTGSVSTVVSTLQTSSDSKIVSSSTADSSADSGDLSTTDSKILSLAAAMAQPEYFYVTTNSDIATYKKMLGAPVGSEVTQDVTVTGANVAVQSFATDAGSPDLSLLPDGTYHVHLHGMKVSGVADVNMYVQLYKRTSGGVETLLLTYDNTPSMTGSEVGYDLSGYMAEQIVNTTDRLVIKVLANKVGVGSDPVLRIGYDGDTASRLELPVGAGGGNFVPVTRLISTTAPLAGGGNLSSDLTLSIDLSSYATSATNSTAESNTLSTATSATGSSVSTANSKDTSQSLLISIANSAGVSAATLDSTSLSNSDSKTLSSVSTANSKDVSQSTNVSTAQSAAISNNSTSVSTAASRGDSGGTRASTADSKAVSDATAISLTDVGSSVLRLNMNLASPLLATFLEIPSAATLQVTGGGASITGANNGGANPTGTIALTAVNGSANTFMRSDGAPALGVGIAPTWTGVHKWNLNSGALPTIPTGSVFQIAQADGTGTRITMEVAASNANITWRRANNTLASPSALAANDAIGQLVGQGYGATGYSATARASVVFFASQIWTDSNQGTYITLATTPDNSTTQATAVTIGQDKSLTVVGAFGCNSKAAQAAYASGGALAAYGAGTNGFDTAAHASALYAMVVAIRAALVADGIMS